MEEMYKLINEYYSALYKTGYIPEFTVKSILLADFIADLVEDPEFYLEATCDEQKLVAKLQECITQNNCLL